MRLFICGSYAIASDHAVFSVATINKKTKLVLGTMMCILLIATAFSGAVSTSSKETEESKEVEVSSDQDGVSPLAQDQDWNFWTNPPNMFSIPTGNIGIGIANPRTKLDVVGTVRMTGFKLATGATNGYVLTSDASGRGTWRQPSGITGTGTPNYIPKFTGSTILGNSLLYETDSNIGIGTTTPDSTLEVAGTIHSSAGGFLFPDGTRQSTAAAPSLFDEYCDGRIYMRAVGNHQGTIEGSCTAPGYEGWIFVGYLDWSVYCPYDPVTGLPTSDDKNQILTVIKPIDKASPLLMKALTTNEIFIDVTIDFVSGPEYEEYYTIELEEAHLVDYEQNVAFSTPYGDQLRLEKLSFTYQRITCTWMPEHIEAQDEWNESNPP